jgi:GNAT superfamily N-acetyltransferase
VFADLALARRIELGEATNAAQCGESIEVGGGYAAFAGVNSPLTHAIGLGLHGPVSAMEFDRMEAFYQARGSPVNLDLYPHADWSMFDFMTARGYHIVECNNVLAGPVIGTPDARVHITDDVDTWSKTVAQGFFSRTGFSEPELDVCRRLLKIEHATAWLAQVDGVPAAGAALNTRGKLALLFADSTLEKYRGHGLHVASIRARLQHAAEQGCDLATASTAAGSTSQRNYERAGFRVIYTKLNMQRDFQERML